MLTFEAALPVAVASPVEGSHADSMPEGGEGKRETKRRPTGPR